MTPEQQELIQASFEQLVTVPEQAASLFYARLFEQQPHLQALFHHDMMTQGRKLMDTLAFAVVSLDTPDRLDVVLDSLGRRHQGYGVQPADYEAVGAALLWMLKQTLGAAFTSEVQAAWAELYGQLAHLMLAGVEGGHSAAAEG